MDPKSQTPAPTGRAAELLLTMGQDVLTRDPGRAAQCFAEAADLAHAQGDAAGEARAWHLTAAAELGRGRHQEADTALKPALELARALGGDGLVAACLNTLGLLRMREGRSDDARTYLRESLGRTTESAGDADIMLTRAETLETLGLVDRETGEPAQAYLYFQEALEARRSADDEAGIASCRNHLGGLCYRMGRFQDAVAHFELALEARRALGDSQGTAATANNLAGTLLQQGKLRESAVLFEESRGIAEELGDNSRLASILSNMGLLLTYQGKVEEAGEHHRESLRLHREAGDLAGQAHALNNLASLEVERGEPEDAVRHADECAALWRDAGRRGNLAKPLVNRGDALLELGRVREAREAAEQALEAAELARSDEYRAEGEALLASALLGEDRFDEASAAAERSLAHARAAGSPHLEASSHTALGRIHAERGDLEAAKLALENSSRLLRGIRHPYERAVLLAEQGRLLGRVGADEAGAERLRRALTEFELLGNARSRTRVLAELAAMIGATDAADAARYRDEARTLAERHGLQHYLAGVEERLAAEHAGNAVTGDVGAFEELTARLLETTASQSADAASCLDAFFHFLARRLGAQEMLLTLTDTVSRRWRLALPRTDGAHFGVRDGDAGDSIGAADGALAFVSGACGAGTAETRTASVGSGAGTLGVLRVARAQPWSGGEEVWLQAAGGVLALALEGHVERMDRAVAPDAEDQARSRFEEFVGGSAPMHEVYRLIEHVAPTRTSALLLGESGTGKELAARAIHARSPRRGSAFVAINCPSIPRELIESELFGHEKGSFTGADTMRPGKVEVADGGTLFLDEVGDMALATQVKLLRFLEEKEFQRVGGNESHKVDVRILAATSRDLDEAIRLGDFREDLFYRLNVVPIRMPSLRERREDLPHLVAHLLARVTSVGHETTPRLSAGAMERLAAYDWPGNVRELRNTLEYMATIGKEDVLDERHLPDAIRRAAASSAAPMPGAPAGLRPGETLESRLQQLEATLIRATLEAENWNQSAGARRLGVTESKIRNRMKQFGIRRPSET